LLLTCFTLQACFKILKDMCLEGGGGGKGGGGGGSNAELEEKIKKLSHQVKQRDNEIVILVNMINEAKKAGGGVCVSAASKACQQLVKHVRDCDSSEYD
jgi:hypothetical protein